MVLSSINSTATRFGRGPASVDGGAVVRGNISACTRTSLLLSLMFIIRSITQQKLSSFGNRFNRRSRAIRFLKTNWIQHEV